MIEHVERDEYPPFLMHLREQGDTQGLIAWMLHPNPYRRPTALEALEGFEEILREASE